MKANHLLKSNIDTLLHKRGQTRRDLAMWVRQSIEKRKVDPWISHIFTNPDNEFQMKYLDRIADFFGLAVYQLFQPGISHLTERRAGHERRSGQDRRINARLPGEQRTIHGVSLSSDDVAVLKDLHELKNEDYQRVRGWITVARLGVGSEQRIE